MNRLLLYNDEQIRHAMESCVDPETGEIIRERFFDALKALPEKEDRIKDLGLIALDLESDIDKIDAEIKRLNERKSAIAKEAKMIRDGIEHLFGGVHNLVIKDPFISVSFRRSERVIETGDEVPMTWKRITTTINKDQAKKALKEGQSIPGLALEEHYNLQIK